MAEGRLFHKGQLSMTRMHSSRMRAIHNSGRLLAGGLLHTPWRPAARHAGIPCASHAGIPPAQDLLEVMLGYHLQGMLGYQPPPQKKTCCKACWNTTPGQTHNCKNITFGTSLRPVKISTVSFQL